MKSRTPRIFHRFLPVLLGLAFGSNTWAGDHRAHTPRNDLDPQSAYLFFLPSKHRAEAERTAKEYASMVDATHGDKQKLRDFYRKALLWKQATLPEDRFLQSIIKTRLDFRSPSDRVLASVDGGFRQLPGYPNGQYVIVSYDVRFPSSPQIYTEQLTLERAASSAHWQFVAYYIATKPFYLYD